MYTSVTCGKIYSSLKNKRYCYHTICLLKNSKKRIDKGGSMYPKQRIFNIITVLLYLSIGSAYAVDSELKDPDLVRLSLVDAERKFLKNNLQLLTAKFQIDARKAAIIQARLWPNPTLNLEQNAWNPGTKRYLDFSRDGQSVVQIQQLFLLGGKIDKRIKLAEASASMGDHLFYDLLRALKYELRTSFYKLYYLQESLEFYDKTIGALQKTVDFIQRAYQNRSVLYSEVLRIKSLKFMLENERTEVIASIKEKEATIRVLLNEPSYTDKTVVTVVDGEKIDDFRVGNIKLSAVIESAIENRPDLKVSVSSVKLEEANLELQRAYALPDVSFGGSFQRANNYIPDYYGMTAQVNLPIFDRNQGNIEVAEKSLISRRVSLKNHRLQVENEVSVAYHRIKEKEKLFQSNRNKLAEEYKELSGQMILNYEKRYITTIEFTDFYEAYRTSLLQMLKLKSERMGAIEELNYSVGETIIRLNEEEVKK